MGVGQKIKRNMKEKEATKA